MIETVAKYHNDWISILKKFGCKDYTEDLVQEMYIRVSKYGKEEKIILNGSVNFSYIYFILKNIYFDFVKDKKRINMLPLNDECYNIQDDLKQYNNEIKFNNQFDKKKNKLSHYEITLYTLRVKHRKSFREIEKHTGISKDELCKDWRNIRNYFNKELINEYKLLKNE